MQRFADWYRDAEGRGYPGAVVTVYESGTSNKPQLYNAGGSISSPAPIPNPTFTDSNGYFAFAVPNGTYDIHLQGGGMPETIIPNVSIGTDSSIIDASDIPYAYPGGTLRSVQSKLEESISVFDYMTSAQLSDVQSRTASIDVSSAFQQALDEANGRPLYVPAGTYRIETTVTSYNISGTTSHGVRVFGDGANNSILLNKVSGGPCFDFDHRIGSTSYADQVFSTGSYMEDVSIVGDAGVSNSDGVRVKGLHAFHVVRCVIRDHTRYGMHYDYDSSYNPDISSSVRGMIVGSSVSYNKIGIYAPGTQACPTLTAIGSNFDWNTDIGIYHCSNYFNIINGSVSFNGYSYSGDYSPSLSYGGYIIANASDGTAYGCSLKCVEFDGNRPQQIYACAAAGIRITECKFGVRIVSSETNKYVVVFGADSPAGLFYCLAPVFDGNTITVNAGSYAGVSTAVIVKFKAGSRYGFVGINSYFVTGTGLTAGSNLFYVSEDTRSGANSGSALGARYLEQNAVSISSAYPVQYRAGIYETIADDSVVSFKPPRNSGLILLAGGSSFTWAVTGFLASTGVTYAVTDSTGVELGPTNTALTGTTGTDGRLTIGARNGVLYIENRLGSATLISATVISSQIGF